MNCKVAKQTLCINKIAYIQSQSGFISVIDTNFVWITSLSHWASLHLYFVFLFLWSDSGCTSQWAVYCVCWSGPLIYYEGMFCTAWCCQSGVLSLLGLCWSRSLGWRSPWSIFLVPWSVWFLHNTFSSSIHFKKMFMDWGHKVTECIILGFHDVLGSVNPVHNSIGLQPVSIWVKNCLWEQDLMTCLKQWRGMMVVIPVWVIEQVSVGVWGVVKGDECCDAWGDDAGGVSCVEEAIFWDLVCGASVGVCGFCNGDSEFRCCNSSCLSKNWGD